MFVLGFHFPASEGNKIEDSKVIEKVDAALGDTMDTVNEIKLFKASNKNSKVESYATLSSNDTFFAKALVQYFCNENEAKEPMYLIYTNKYQISQIAKNADKGNEEIENLCRWFDGMDPVVLDVSFK